MIKKCKICGNIYKVSRIFKKYCCKICSEEATRLNNIKYQKSEKGREAAKRYCSSPKAIAKAKERYKRRSLNPKFMEWRRKYHREYYRKKRKDKKWRENFNERNKKYQKKRMSEFVKVPKLVSIHILTNPKENRGFPKERKMMAYDYIYCNGMSKEIQEKIPELMDKIALKLLKRK